MSYEKLGKGVVKRTERRVLGVFIDGIGLDRAMRRLARKVEISKLIKGVSAGIPPTIARYYTVIPYEDDARQFAFLEAVSRAGLTVIVKRLPPKGSVRQVTADVEMGSDIVAFAQGLTNFGSLGLYLPQGSREQQRIQPLNTGKAVDMGKLAVAAAAKEEQAKAKAADGTENPIQRIVTVVCPSHEISYSIALANEVGADTVTADFSDRRTRDVLKSSAKWIDLSTSESIWRE